MNISVDALVLRAVDYREGDKILTLLTRQRGRLTVKASGARRRGSRLASCTQPLCYSEMALFEKDGRFTLDEGFVKEQFYGLCSDIEKISLAGYFAQVLMNEPEDSPGSDAALRLALNCLYALDKNIAPQTMVKAVFELRYMSLCGYTPDISACSVCGMQGGGGYINLESGQYACEKCSPSGGYNDVYLDAPALEAARYILFCDLKRLFAFRLPGRSVACLAAFAESYLLYRTEQGYNALEFYKSLFKQEEHI